MNEAFFGGFFFFFGGEGGASHESWIRVVSQSNSFSEERDMKENRYIKRNTL